MFSNSTAAAGSRAMATTTQATTAPAAQHRYLPAAQPAPGSPPKLNKAQLVDRLKSAIIEMVYCDEPPKIKNSLHLSRELGHEYTYLARVFSEETGSTIERYFIVQKIERVKELLRADILSVSQIASLLNYSNIGHLCNQFKKVTGVTPSFFKQLMRQRAVSLAYLSRPAENDVITFCNHVIVALVRPANFAG